MCIFSIPNFGLNVAELTENVDKSIRHQVPKFVGGVTLVDGAWPWLHVAENNSVAIHLPPVVFRCVCFKMTMAATLFRRKGCVGVWKEGTPILLTFYGDAVDKPGNHRFRLTTDSASQDACLIRRKDQVPRSADPEWSRCERMTGVISTLLWFPFQTSCKWWGQRSELSSTTLHHNGCVPFTVTLMMWCTVPSRFVAVQRYSPASVSTTSEILSVFWKVWKDTLLLGSSPPSFCQEISGVGLSLTEIQTQVLTLKLFQLFFSCFKCWVLTYKPSAMHSNSRVSPLRTILVLVDPIGYMNLGSWSPFGFSEGTRTRWHHKQKAFLVDVQRIWNI